MILTIITFIIILSILVFAHELGHFITAKRFGVTAEEFGFGFPPRMFGIQTWREKKVEKIGEQEEVEIEVEQITEDDQTEIIKEVVSDKIEELDQVRIVRKWRWFWGRRELTPDDQKYGTVFSINWIPLGGFVKIKGENGENIEEKDSFASRPVWQRFMMLVAGVAMNIVLAMGLIIIGYMIGLPQVIDQIDPRAQVSDQKLQITQVFDQSPANRAGLKIGDTIISINGIKFTNYDDLQKYVASHINQELTYKIKQGQEQLDKKIIPELRPETNKGGVGIGITLTGIVKYPWYLAVWLGIKTTFVLIWVIISAFYQLIKGLIMGQGVSAELAGPVGIAALTGEVARMGLIYIMQFTALLSINLAVINFLPFPALDGGRALFLAIEKIKGVPVKREIENIIHNIGFVLLMILVLLVTFRDVNRLGGIGDKLKMLWGRIFG